jgi:hypothetical protein
LLPSYNDKQVEHQALLTLIILLIFISFSKPKPQLKQAVSATSVQNYGPGKHNEKIWFEKEQEKQANWYW